MDVTDKWWLIISSDYTAIYLLGDHYNPGISVLNKHWSCCQAAIADLAWLAICLFLQWQIHQKWYEMFRNGTACIVIIVNFTDPPFNVQTIYCTVIIVRMFLNEFLWTHPSRACQRWCAGCIFSHMSWHRTCQEAPVNDAENDKDRHSHWIPLWGSNYLDIISRLDPQIVNKSRL